MDHGVSLSGDFSEEGVPLRQRSNPFGYHQLNVDVIEGQILAIDGQTRGYYEIEFIGFSFGAVYVVFNEVRVSTWTEYVDRNGNILVK